MPNSTPRPNFYIVYIHKNGMKMAEIAIGVNTMNSALYHSKMHLRQHEDRHSRIFAVYSSGKTVLAGKYSKMDGWEPSVVG